MRTFVALNFPAAERTRMYAALAPLRDRSLPYRWAPAATLHLTLRFLGDTEGVEIERIDETLRDVAESHEPLTLRLGGLGAFPSLRRANVVWLGIESDPALMALQRDLDLAMSRLGYGREQKPFRPHVTVGRLRSGARAPDVERLTGDVGYEGVVEVSTIDLMRSHLTATGAHYEPLLRPALGPRLESEP